MEADALERKLQEIAEERRKLEAERKMLEQEKKLFDMKWKILEDEFRKLAAEKEQVLRQREFYRYVNEFNYGSSYESREVVKGEMFFCGVDSEELLKKRYKDLIKIYHPDNAGGDNTTLQEINTEYEKLKALYE